MSSSKIRVRRRNKPNPPKLLKLGYELRYQRAFKQPSGELYITDEFERSGAYGLEGPLKLYNAQAITVGDPPYKSIEATLDEKHKGPPYKIGGPFRRVDFNLRYDNKVYGFGNVDSDPKDSQIRGGIFPPPEVLWEHGDLFTNPYPMLDGGQFFPSLLEYHNRAWNKLKPKIESTGGFVFLAELRDLPGQLRTSARFFNRQWLNWLERPDTVRSIRNIRQIGRLMPREVADHWLNHSFGWAPFINDLVNIKDTMTGYIAKTQALTDTNGQWVKGRVVVKDENSTTMVKRVDSGNYLPGYTVLIPWKYLNGPIVYEIWDDYRSKIYATGEFAFYRPEFDRGRPDFDSVFNKVHRLLTVYGVRVTPVHLYQIMPWSWLVDWFTGLGNYFQYLQDIWLDSLVGRECYIMCKKHVIRSFRIHVPFKSGVKNFIFTREIVTKQRDPFSSPYGPSLSWSDLNSRQLSILAALGITRR